MGIGPEVCDWGLGRGSVKGGRKRWGGGGRLTGWLGGMAVCDIRNCNWQPVAPTQITANLVCKVHMPHLQRSILHSHRLCMVCGSVAASTCTYSNVNFQTERFLNKYSDVKLSTATICKYYDKVNSNP